MPYGRIIEACILLFVIPLCLAVLPAKLSLRVPLLPVLLLGASYTLWRCRGQVDFKKVFSRPHQGWWRAPLARACVVAVLSLGFCLMFLPELLFDFPRHKTTIWVLVLCLYPFLSVLPQEIIYSLYFFEVVASGKQGKWLKIGLGTLLFSWVHIIYDNSFALWGTLIGGAVFNWLYWSYRDEPGVMWRVIVEHSLYGLIIFTVGLGGFFFLAR